MKARALPSAAFFAGLIIFLSVKVWLAFRPHVLIWDEAVYLGMGKYIYSLGSIGLWEILRPPLLPLILGVFWKASTSVFIWELIILAFSAGYAIVVYLLGKELFDDSVGSVAGSIVLLTPLYFLYSGFFLTDIPSAFFMMLSILLIVRHNYIFGGIIAGLAFLSRFPHGLAIAGIGLALLLPAWRECLQKYCRVILGFSTTVVPFIIFNYFMYRTEADFFDALLRPLILAAPHQGNVLAGTGRVLFYVTRIITDNFLYMFVLAGMIIYIARCLYVQKQTNILFFTAFLYLVYFSSIANKQDRFGFAFLGLFALIAAYGLVSLLRWGFGSCTTRMATGIILAVTFGALVIIPAMPGDYESPLAREMAYMRWRHTAEPPIVREFYQYFEERESNSRKIDGAILTADPVPAGYVDQRFVPYYFSVREGYKVFEQTLAHEQVGAIIYTPRSFVCAADDAECTQLLEKLERRLAGYPLMFNSSFDDNPYLIYEVK